MSIYVGNIAYSMKESELEKLFQEFGNVVSAKIISDKMSGRSKGYGFVELDDEADEEAAITSLNGKEINGRNLKVNKANQKREERN
ncbi:MAG TPA: RNA-binding protein [Bacteroidales bacterium]|nr:RNA-binding protein [Bacteroidales bacterium]